MPNFRTLFVGAALALMASSGVAHAQKMAIIDMQRAVLSTTDGKKVAAAIDAKYAPVKAEMDQLSKEIVAKQTQVAQNRASMSPAATASAQAEIESLSTALKRKQEDAQQDLQDDETKQLGNIVPKLQQIINSYAAANQISFVVDTSANPNNLIYGHSSVDITGQIVAAYEKAAGVPAPAPSGTQTTPAAPATPPKPAAPKTTAPAK